MKESQNMRNPAKRAKREAANACKLVGSYESTSESLAATKIESQVIRSRCRYNLSLQDLLEQTKDGAKHVKFSIIRFVVAEVVKQDAREIAKHLKSLNRSARFSMHDYYRMRQTPEDYARRKMVMALASLACEEYRELIVWAISQSDNKAWLMDAFLQKKEKND